MAPVTNSTQDHNLINHGDPDLICTVGWTSILTFYVANYIAHCATVKPYPAETLIEFSVAVILALFFPSSGVIRALDSIFRHSRLLKYDELQKAARAGALCMVCRSSDWVPQVGDRILGLGTSRSSTYRVSRDAFEAWKVASPPWQYEHLRTTLPKGRILRRGCKIHGIYSLPKGYELTYIPSDAKLFKAPTNCQDVTIEVASTYSLAKTAIAVLQTAYAAVTLYRTRGNQIELFGYASFGLTVTPYLVMSLLNLLGQLVTPDYPQLYLVQSPEMDEARRRGGYFDGVIGSLSVPERNSYSPNDMFTEWTVESVSSDLLEAPERHYSGTSPTPKVSTADNDTFSKLLGEVTTFSLRDTTPGVTSTKVLQIHCKSNSRQRLAECTIPSCSPFDRLLSSRMDFEGAYTVKPDRRSSGAVIFWIPLAIGSLSLLVMGLLSQFRKGSSTKAQRAWTMSWLILGMIFGSLSDFWTNFLIPKRDGFKRRDTLSFVGRIIGFVLLFGVLLAPAVGGFVVVGQMLSSFGNCQQIA